MNSFFETAKPKMGYISQVSPAIFPFLFSQQRRTWIITKNVLCGRGQKYRRLERRKWKEVTGLYQFSLRNGINVTYATQKKGAFVVLTCQKCRILQYWPLIFYSSRSIYQKFREVDLLDKKKTVTALKPGEDRAILLGLGMILSSVMMYFVLGITTLRSYADRYRPDERVMYKNNVLFIKCSVEKPL